MQPDPEIVNQLVGMGFSENGSKRAAVATQVGVVPGILLLLGNLHGLSSIGWLWKPREEQMRERASTVTGR